MVYSRHKTKVSRLLALGREAWSCGDGAAAVRCWRLPDMVYLDEIDGAGAGSLHGLVEAKWNEERVLWGVGEPEAGARIWRRQTAGSDVSRDLAAQAVAANYTLAQQLGGVHGHVRQAEAKAQGAISRMGGLEGEVGRLHRVVDQMKAKHDVLQGHIDELQRKLEGVEEEKSLAVRSLREFEADLVASSPHAVKMKQALMAKDSEVRALEQALATTQSRLAQAERDRDTFMEERDYARRFEGRLRDAQQFLSEVSRRYESLRARYIAVVAAEDGIMPLLDHSVEEAFRLQQAIAQFSGIGLRRITNPTDRKLVAAFIESLGENGQKVHNKVKNVLLWCHNNAQLDLEPIDLPEYLQHASPERLPTAPALDYPARRNPLRLND